MEMWRDIGHMSNLTELEQKRGKMGMREKKALFFFQCTRESEKEKREYQDKLQFLSTIYEARLLGFRKAKN